jgi:hypothetical protein
MSTNFIYSSRDETVRSTSIRIGKGMKGVGGAAGKESYTVQTTNIFSQRQYFVARCLR